MSTLNGTHRPKQLRPNLAVGSVVRLWPVSGHETHTNQRLDGALGEVERVEPWGAVVKVAAAATGQYRAAWCELEVVGTDTRSNAEVAKDAAAAQGQAYTGEVCTNCQGSRMIRAGACSCCLDCGTSGGCG